MKKYSSTMRANSRRTSQTKKRIGAIVLVSIVALVLFWLVPRAVSVMVATISTPIQLTKTWLWQSSDSLPQYFRDRTALINENEDLREELALQAGVEHSLDLLVHENEELRSLLGGDEDTRIMAGIIGRPDELPYDVLVIDQGTNDGVVLNAPVYIGEDRVIGVVQKVFSNSAVIELITTPGFTTSVYIVGPNIYTNAVGMGAGQLRVGVPQGIVLTEGDSVILPSVQSGVFGTINHIESLPTKPEQYGYVSTDIPLHSLRFVAVGSAPLEPVSFETAEEIVASGLNDLFEVPVPEGVLVVTGNATSTATTTNATSSEATDNESEL